MNDEKKPDRPEPTPKVLARPPVPPPPAVEVGVGDTVGSYRLTGELGRSAMALVFLAEAPDGAAAAVKLARRGFDNGKLRALYRGERRRLGELDHPGIVRVLDDGVLDDGRPWLVREVVAGESIDVHCDQRGLDAGERLAIFLELCDAVGHVHRRRVVHRDLKPPDVLVPPGGRPTLIDFGIALHLDEDDPAAGEPLMTPHYASPEQLRGEPLEPSSDVYSLGVILYRLLAGRLPRGDGLGLGPREMTRLLDGAPPAPPSGRPALDRVVLRALSLEAGERYADADAFADALRRDGSPF